MKEINHIVKLTIFSDISVDLTHCFDLKIQLGKMVALEQFMVTYLATATTYGQFGQMVKCSFTN